VFLFVLVHESSANVRTLCVVRLVEPAGKYRSSTDDADQRSYPGDEMQDLINSQGNSESSSVYGHSGKNQKLTIVLFLCTLSTNTNSYWVTFIRCLLSFVASPYL